MTDLTVYTEYVDIPTATLRKVCGPANYTLKSMCKRLKVTITFEDVGTTTRVCIAGADESKVQAAVADIRALAGPLPLLAGVPVPQHVFDRLKKLDTDAPSRKNDPQSVKDLRALGYYDRETAAAWAAERRAGAAADRAARLVPLVDELETAAAWAAEWRAGAAADGELETTWTDGELTTTHVAKWPTPEVQHWARLCAGCTEADAERVDLDGPTLLGFPVYPSEELEAHLAVAGISHEGVMLLAAAYQEQQWTITTTTVQTRWTQAHVAFWASTEMGFCTADQAALSTWDGAQLVSADLPPALSAAAAETIVAARESHNWVRQRLQLPRSTADHGY